MCEQFAPSAPDPPQDRPRVSMPKRIGALLCIVRVLLDYGRHLAETAADRAAAPSFTSLAACFGTADLSTIRAHLQRGILRALALESVLLARAARGRDIESAARHKRLPAAADQKAASPTPRPAPIRQASVPTRRVGRHDPSDVEIPTWQQLQAQVRRRPLGRTIIDICLDLAVVPGFCTGTFWNELFDLTRRHGGSIAVLARERSRREQAFSQQQDRHPTPGWNWWNPTRATLRQALGFFIGEELPALPPAPTPAAILATGPP